MKIRSKTKDSRKQGDRALSKEEEIKRRSEAGEERVRDGNEGRVRDVSCTGSNCTQGLETSPTANRYQKNGRGSKDEGRE